MEELVTHFYGGGQFDIFDIEVYVDVNNAITESDENNDITFPKHGCGMHPLKKYFDNYKNISVYVNPDLVPIYNVDYANASSLDKLYSLSIALNLSMDGLIVDSLKAVDEIEINNLEQYKTLLMFSDGKINNFIKYMDILYH